LSLLVTGGAGYVGSIIKPVFEQQHHARYLDIKPVADVGDRMILGDVNDDELVAKSLEGVESIVWLAMGKKPDTRGGENDTGFAFNVNVTGFYRVLFAAVKAGVRRFVYTSSMSVYDHCGSEKHHPLAEDKPADAWRPYGASKRVAEMIGEAATRDFPGLCFVSLRLMWPRTDADWPGNEYKSGAHWQPLGPNDTRDLFSAAIRFYQPGFYAFTCTGDVEGINYPQTRARDILGWVAKGR
jgi:nucleoside-diphosphate-sugar epimerase